MQREGPGDYRACRIGGQSDVLVEDDIIVVDSGVGAGLNGEGAVSRGEEHTIGDGGAVEDINDRRGEVA